MNTERVIAIVGAGFSGTVLAARLLRTATDPLRILLIERAAEIGRGLAYVRADYPFPLNVRPTGMSATDDELDFQQYVRHQHPELDADGFLPRELYGDYLQWTLDDAARRASPGVVLHSVRGKVVDIEAAPAGGLRLCLADGRTHRADQVVVATGFVRGTGVTTYGAPGNSLLAVGTGLTMIDTVLAAVSRDPRLTVHAMSRHGLLPLTQAPTTVPATPKLPPLGLSDLAHTARGLVSQARCLAQEARARGADWRDVINQQLRPQLPALWQRLPTAERARFLRHARSYWDVHRHRAPSEVAARIQILLASGQLRIHAGRIQDIQTRAGGVEVMWTPRGEHQSRSLVVAQVVNCSGPSVDPANGGDALWNSLIRRGWAASDSLGQGVQTGAQGELLGTAGRVSPGLFYVGPLLRAGHWEATAVAELRVHLARTARALLADQAVWVGLQQEDPRSLTAVSPRHPESASIQRREALR